MKRVYYSLMILTLCIVNSSCEWYYKTFGDVESCTEWYWEEMYETIKEDDLEAVIDLTYSMREWLETLSEEELITFETTAEKWEEEHPYKAERIEDYFRKHRDEIPK